MANCSKCNRDGDADKFSVTCDRCGLVYCLKCSKLTSTELRAVVLKSRIMKFFCEKCDDSQHTGVLDNLETPDGADEFDMENAGNSFLALNALIQPFFDKISNLEIEIKNLKESNIELIRMLTKKPELITGVDIINQKNIGYIKNADKVKINTGVLASNENKVKVSTHNKPERETKSADKLGVEKCMTKNGRTLKDDCDANVTGQMSMSQLDNGPSMATEDSSNYCSNEPGGEFHEVRYRKRRPTKALELRQGTANEVNVFSSEPKKAWLYIGKAGIKTNCDIVKKYISNKLGIDDDQLVVESLRSAGAARSYKVGVYYDYYDQVNKPEFWPAGVVFRRFSFSSPRYFHQPELPIPMK